MWGAGVGAVTIGQCQRRHCFSSLIGINSTRRVELVARERVWVVSISSSFRDLRIVEIPGIGLINHRVKLGYLLDRLLDPRGILMLL